MKRTKNTFPEGYGQFTYIMIKIGHARYVQLPIHRVSKEDHSEYKGVFISDPEETEAEVLKQHNLEALMEVRKQHFEKHKYISPCV